MQANTNKKRGVPPSDVMRTLTDILLPGAQDRGNVRRYSNLKVFNPQSITVAQSGPQKTKETPRQKNEIGTAPNYI